MRQRFPEMFFYLLAKLINLKIKRSLIKQHYKPGISQRGILHLN